mgnify:CR=1 FL=1
MRNFPSVLDQAGVPRMVVTASVRGSVSKEHLLRSEEHWGWREVRDYVMDQIQTRQGAQTTDPNKLIGIFKGFVSRWGDQAPAICRYVFETCDGIWMGRPVTVTSWCKKADPFFSEAITDRLARLG